MDESSTFSCDCVRAMTYERTPSVANLVSADLVISFLDRQAGRQRQISSSDTWKLEFHWREEREIWEGRKEGNELAWGKHHQWLQLHRRLPPFILSIRNVLCVAAGALRVEWVSSVAPLSFIPPKHASWICLDVKYEKWRVKLNSVFSLNNWAKLR